MAEIVNTRFVKREEPQRWTHHECLSCGAFVADPVVHAEWHAGEVGQIVDFAPKVEADGLGWHGPPIARPLVEVLPEEVPEVTAAPVKKAAKKRAKPRG